MDKDDSYTLVELAERSGLTPRTVRYYIEQVLPGHHKKGRGKLARYGNDTLNCLRFILLVGERHGLKPGQVKGVLATIPQETVDRIVEGKEELAVMPVPSPSSESGKVERVSKVSRSSVRRAKYLKEEPLSVLTEPFSAGRSEPLSDASYTDMSMNSEASMSMDYSESRVETTEPWRTVFSDEQLRIQCRKDEELTANQEEQIRTAARLIELALK